jgi:putative transposase
MVERARARRQQVAYLQQRGLSIRRACALMSVARSTLGYESRLIKRDAPVLAVMHELASAVSSIRLSAHPGLSGASWAHDERRSSSPNLWRKCGLQVPRKRPRRRIATGRPRPLPATGAGYLWAYDFVFDACANGQQLKCLTVIDEYTRECLAIDVAGSIEPRDRSASASSVSVHGAPNSSDNGPEFVSEAVIALAKRTNIDTAHIDPGKPWQNGMNESFNGKFRDECLNMQWFKNRIDAKILIEEFRRQYNEVRPHSSLDQLTPAEFKRTTVNNQSRRSHFRSIE